MRLSVRKTDPGYHKNASKYRPYLNGTKVKECFTADEDLGYIWVHKTDGNGKILLNESKTDILTEQLFGEVELRLLKDDT